MYPKHIISYAQQDKLAKFIAYVVLAICIFFVIITALIFLDIFAIGGEGKAPGFIALLIFDIFLIFALTICNRQCQRVRRIDDTIYRSGLWFGYDKEIKISDIVTVKSVLTGLGSFSLIIIHKTNGKSGKLIIKDTFQNRCFITDFWKKDIEN